MKNNKFSKNKFKGMMYGAILGDILGVPYEFLERGTFEITDMISGGSHEQPLGYWSDDTSLTLISMLAMLDDINIDSDKYSTSYMNRLVRYKDDGYMTPGDEVFDIGITTAYAVMGYKNNKEIYQGIDNMNQNGNGVLMRIHPDFFFLDYEYYSYKQKLDWIKHTTCLTHGHWIAQYTNLVYLEFIYHLMLNKEPMDAFEDTINYLNENGFKEDTEGLFIRLFSNYKTGTVLGKIDSGGYCLNTLENSIYCFLHTDSYEEAVFRAINLGGDTDTNGTVTGALAGIYYGYKSLNKEWLNNIVKKEEIDIIIEKFYDNFINKKE